MKPIGRSDWARHVNKTIHEMKIKDVHKPMKQCRRNEFESGGTGPAQKWGASTVLEYN